MTNQPPEERPLKEEGFILALSWKMQPIPPGTQWQNRMPLLTSQGIRKQVERTLASCRLSSFPPSVYSVQDPWDGANHIQTL